MVRALPLLGVLLVACASAPPAVRQAPSEPLHDPTAEWSERPSSAVRAPSEPRLLRTPVPPPAPPPELRDFTDDEEQRIGRVQAIVQKAAHTHGLPPDLVNGIIWVESKFMPRARGKRGPRGLMQLMPRTAREVAHTLGRRYEPYDPDFNIHAGTYYFARMVERFDGNLRLALAAYNIGPGTVQRWLRDAEPLPEHSEAYVDNVFTAARAFRVRVP